MIMAGAILPLLFSCNKGNEENSGIDGGPAVIAIQGAGDGLMECELTDTKTSTTIDLRIEATTATPNMLSIGLKVDLTLVGAYNEANETDYEALPADAFDLKSSSVILPQYNKVSSTGQITIDGAYIPGNGDYLLPVAIDKIEGEDNTVVTEGGDVLYILVSRNFTVQTVRKYELSQVLNPSGAYHAICVLPDGKIAVSGNNDGTYGCGIMTIDPSAGTHKSIVKNYMGNVDYNITAYGLAEYKGILYIGYKNSAHVGKYDLSSGSEATPEIVVTDLSEIVDVDSDGKGNIYVLSRNGFGSIGDNAALFKYPVTDLESKVSNSSTYMIAQFEGRALSMCMEPDGDLMVFTVKGFYRVPADGDDPVHIFGAYGGDVDGTGVEAKFGDVYNFCMDPNGNIWAADYSYKKIKFIAKGESDDYSDATVSTVYGGDATLGSFSSGANSPRGIAINEDGTEVYFNSNETRILYKITVTETQQ